MTRAELDDERSFLLDSLEDLERERAAGDLSDADYEVLRDRYTRRAAEVLRALDQDDGPNNEGTEARHPDAGPGAHPEVTAGVVTARPRRRRRTLLVWDCSSWWPRWPSRWWCPGPAPGCRGRPRRGRWT